MVPSLTSLDLLLADLAQQEHGPQAKEVLLASAAKQANTSLLPSTTTRAVCLAHWVLTTHALASKTTASFAQLELTKTNTAKLNARDALLALLTLKLAELVSTNVYLALVTPTQMKAPTLAELAHSVQLLIQKPEELLASGAQLVLSTTSKEVYHLASLAQLVPSILKKVSTTNSTTAFTEERHPQLVSS